MFRKNINIILLLLFIVIISSCNNIKSVDNKSTNSSNTNISDEVVVGKKYKFKGLTNIYNSTDIFNGAKLLFRLSNKDYKVIVKEINGDFAKIEEPHGKEGWVLKWYLTNKLDNEIIQIYKAPLEKVIKEDCFFSIYPDESKSNGYEINSGEVVHIMAEYMDWYCVELIEYENKTFVDKWLKKSNTIDFKNLPTKVENPFDYGRIKIKGELIGFIQNAESIDMLSLGTGESYAQIKGEDIKQFTELIKDTTIGPNPDIQNYYTSVEAELLIKSKGKERSIMLAKSYFQYFPFQRWQQNQDYLIFNNEDIYKKIRELFNRK